MLRRFAGSISGGLDPDYKAVLEFAESEGITLPDSTQQKIDSDLLKAYKREGLWDIDDVFFKFKGDYPDNNFRLIDWKRLVKANSFGGLIYSNDGIKGNATDAYVDTLYNPNSDKVNFTLNNNAITEFKFIVNTVNQSAYFNYGVLQRTPSLSQINVLSNRSGGQVKVYSNNGLFTSQSNLGALGINIFDRNTLNDVQYITNFLNQINHNSNYIPNYNMYLFCRNDEGVANSFSDVGMSYFTIGASRRDKVNEIKNILI